MIISDIFAAFMWTSNKSGNDSELQEMMQDELHVIVARMCKPLGLRPQLLFWSKWYSVYFSWCTMVLTSQERGREGGVVDVDLILDGRKSWRRKWLWVSDLLLGLGVGRQLQRKVIGRAKPENDLKPSLWSSRAHYIIWKSHSHITKSLR